MVSAQRFVAPTVGALALTTVAGLPIVLCGAFAIQMRGELGLDPQLLGLAAGTFYGSAALSAPMQGAFVDRAGSAQVMRVAAAMSGLSLFAIALVVSSELQLLLALVVAGAANATAQTSSNVYLAHSITRSRLATSMSIKQSANQVASLIGGIAVPLVALSVGWRWGFLASGVAAALLVLVLRSGRHVRRPQAADGIGPCASGTAVLLLGLTFGVGAGGAAIALTFGVTSAVDAGYAEGVAGVIVGICSALGIVTRLMVGHLADRRNWSSLRSVMGILAVAAAGFLLLATERRALVIPGLVIALTLGWAWVALFHVSVIRSNPVGLGRVAGRVQAGGSAGGLLAPIGFGWLANHVSYGAAWMLAAMMAVGGAAFAAAARRRILADFGGVRPAR